MALASTLVLLGCDPPYCVPETRGRVPQTDVGGPDIPCSNAWTCHAGLAQESYEVRCVGWEKSTGWISCECIRNGVVERQIGSGGPWCGSGTPDGYERISDANRVCEWKMPTTGI